MCVCPWSVTRRAAAREKRPARCSQPRATRIPPAAHPFSPSSRCMLRGTTGKLHRCATRSTHREQAEVEIVVRAYQGSTACKILLCSSMQFISLVNGTVLNCVIGRCTTFEQRPYLYVRRMKSGKWK
eukprot:gene13889-biopygen12594